MRAGPARFVAEGADAHVQRTKPQTLAAGLTDSPAGLASWILEKSQSWGDGGVFDRVPTDLFLKNLSVYWFTRTAGSAARYYYDTSAHPPAGGRVTVPTGFGFFPADIDHGPPAFARRWYPVERFTRFDRGGHFGALGQPRALAQQGLGALRVRSVADAAGVSPAQVQYYFRTKAEFVTAAFNRAGGEPIVSCRSVAGSFGLVARRRTGRHLPWPFVVQGVETLLIQGHGVR